MYIFYSAILQDVSWRSRNAEKRCDKMPKRNMTKCRKTLNTNLRSKTAIRTSNTRYFVDPSIAAAALGLGPQDLIEDLNTFGLLFEAMCVRDLRVFADVLKKVPKISKN